MGIEGCWQADSQRLLNEVMVEHFFRQGVLDVAEELCQVGYASAGGGGSSHTAGWDMGALEGALTPNVPGDTCLYKALNEIVWQYIIRTYKSNGFW